MYLLKKGGITLKKLGLTALVATMGIGIFTATDAKALRDIDPIDFSISYSYTKDVPGDGYKIYHGHQSAGRYVVNLENSSGSANVKTVLHNSNHESRGSGTLDRGTRASFYNTGTAGYYYHLNMKRTYSGGDIYVKGSWSPDSQD